MSWSIAVGNEVFPGPQGNTYSPKQCTQETCNIQNTPRNTTNLTAFPNPVTEGALAAAVQEEPWNTTTEIRSQAQMILSLTG